MRGRICHRVHWREPDRPGTRHDADFEAAADAERFADMLRLGTNVIPESVYVQNNCQFGSY